MGFYAVMANMWQPQVEVAFRIATTPDQTPTFTDLELHVCEALLDDREETNIRQCRLYCFRLVQTAQQH